MNIKKYFYKIQDKFENEFSFRTVLVLIIGALLFCANIAMFVLAAVYGFKSCNIVKVAIGFCFGVIGVLLSSVLIVMLTFEQAFPPQKKSPLKDAPFQAALKKEGRERIKKLIAIIFAYVLIFGAGFAGIGYFVSQEVKYSHYKTVEAVVVDAEQDVTHKWYPIYEYTVDGKMYTVKGKISSSGLAATGKGDRVIIKYDPQNPETIINRSENMFYMLGGMFFIYIGCILLLYELNARGGLKQEFFASFIMIGIGLVGSLGVMVGKFYANTISLLGDNLWIFFLATFINAGIMECVGGITWLGYKKKSN